MIIMMFFGMSLGRSRHDMERRRKPCSASSVSACAFSSARATGRQAAGARSTGADRNTVCAPKIAEWRTTIDRLQQAFSKYDSV
jgi:hypothetical protein